ncbi:hypothetical protein CesoFtcFv8_006019 [Champsocephalus esox]|uniref:Uncharacterized protein n=1 Tax=Champsocephalus esox TaxID=159716 RepID=A0AAN8CLR5_9TELE|nr:hypothetical protein CesoFtcFv8_006019 [Champsocephalus esox]
MSCCALECTNRTSKKSTLSFFRFPLVHTLSHHFSTDSWGRRCLKNTAVPTIFYFTKEQQPRRKSRDA